MIGWELDRTLEEHTDSAALRVALVRRTVQASLIHHFDRGWQYASGAYTDLLQVHGNTISKSRKVNPWDNAACEYS